MLYKKREILFLLLLILVLIIPNSNANVIDDLNDITNLIKEEGMRLITGMGSTSATTVTIQVGNNPPNISYVSLNETITITEGGVKYIEVTFLANDTEGTGNLNNASALVNVSYSGAGGNLSSNNTCTAEYVPTMDVINYSCTVAIEYWYEPGNWNVDAEIADVNGNKDLNATEPNGNGNGTSWDLQQTVSMNATVTALTFPTIAPSDINKTSSNDPITVENTGNKDGLAVLVEGIDLLDDTDGSTDIGANNFTVGTSTGSNAECDNSSAALILANNSAITITGTSIGRGQGATDDIYFCLIESPSNLETDVYSTGGVPDEEDWTVSVS